MYAVCDSREEVMKDNERGGNTLLAPENRKQLHSKALNPGVFPSSSTPSITARCPLCSGMSAHPSAVSWLLGRCLVLIRPARQRWWRTRMLGILSMCKGLMLWLLLMIVRLSVRACLLVVVCCPATPSIGSIGRGQDTSTRSSCSAAAVHKKLLQAVRGDAQCFEGGGRYSRSRGHAPSGNLPHQLIEINWSTGGGWNLPCFRQSDLLNNVSGIGRTSLIGLSSGRRYIRGLYIDGRQDGSLSSFESSRLLTFRASGR